MTNNSRRARLERSFEILQELNAVAEAVLQDFDLVELEPFRTDAELSLFRAAEDLEQEEDSGSSPLSTPPSARIPLPEDTLPPPSPPQDFSTPLNTPRGQSPVSRPPSPHSAMAAVHQIMPVRNDRGVPLWNDTNRDTVEQYFDELERIMLSRNIPDADKKPSACLYVPVEVSKRWKTLPTYRDATKTFQDFRTEVESFYVGADASHIFTRREYQDIVHTTGNAYCTATRHVPQIFHNGNIFL